MFSFFIARRYLFSRKKQNIINIISLVSVVGIAVGSMALIVILSVFNGFEDLVDSLLSSFNPDMKVVPATGKTFSMAGIQEGEVLSIPGVISMVEVVEENALLRYRDKQHIVKLKAVSDEYLGVTSADSMLVEGELILHDGDVDYGIFGLGVAYFLELAMRDYLNPVQVYVPKRSSLGGINPMEAFNNASIFPSGIFSIQQEYDVGYVIIPISLGRQLLEYTDEVTSLDIYISTDASAAKVQDALGDLLGEKFRVLNSYQQEETIYKIMRSERWAIFFILTFILLIATFNVIGSLSMLILEKRKDVSVLWSMGANQRFLRKVFFTEGMLIAGSGAVAGLLAGAFLCWLQEKYGLIQLQASEGAFVINAYPVHMVWSDFLLVFFTVLSIGALATLLPVSRLKAKEFDLQSL